MPEWLIGDANRLRQVVVNLVGNAVKFTDAGEVLLRVDCLEKNAEQAILCCSVIDSGIGIAPDKQDAIFNAFEQADNSTTRRHGGTGLGLAISSRLVQAMGGRIWVESEVGRGSTFHFTVRLGVAAAAPASVRHRPREAAEGIRVLIVDDNATNRLILAEMLTNWRMLPVAVPSVPEALAALRSRARETSPF